MFYICLPSPNKRFACLQNQVGNAQYGMLYIPLRRGRPRWRLLRKRLKETPFQALVAQEMPTPEFIRPYYTDGYYRRLLFNAFLYVCGGAKHLALVDPDGRMPELAAELLQQTRQVTVFTYATKVYTPHCAEWLATLGTQPVLTQRLAVLQKAVGMFAPFECGIRLGDPSRLTFGPGGYGVLTRELTLPPPYNKALPAGVSPFAFAAALYTQCGEKALERLLPPTLILGNGTVNIHKLKADNFRIDKTN